MNKVIAVLVLVVVLAGLLSFFSSSIAGASSSALATNVTMTYSWQRHSFNANGTEFVFYNVSGSWYFKTGNITGNVSSWSGATSLTTYTGSAIGYDAVYFDGTYVSVAGVGGSCQNTVGYRRGQVDASAGTISWSAWHTVITGYSAYFSVNIVTDSAGFPLVSCEWDNACGGYGYGGIQLWVGSANDGSGGTWTQYAMDSTEVSHAHIGFATSAGHVTFIYTNGSSHLYAKIWNGTGLSAAYENTGTYYTYNSDTISGVNSGNSVDIVWKSSTGSIYYSWFDASTHDWVGTTSITNGASGSTYPVLQANSDQSRQWVYLENYPVDNDITAYTLFGGLWVYSFPVSDTYFSDAWKLCASASVPFVCSSFYYINAAQSLITVYGWYDTGLPYAAVAAASGITSGGVTLNGYILSVGNSTTTGYFELLGAGGGVGNYTLPGGLYDGEFLSQTVTGLLPGNDYTYYIYVSNTVGATWSGAEYFTTLGNSTPTCPFVYTMLTEDLCSTSVTLIGHLPSDGGLPCYCGFLWRVYGSSTWVTSWKLDSGGSYIQYRSVNNHITGSLSGLNADTTYEYKFFAVNGVCSAGVFGATMQFTTGHVGACGGATPTPTPGGVPPGIPTDWAKYLSSNVKLVIALIVTLGAMVLVGVRVKGKSAGILVVATGGACVVAFTVFGWYPSYVIILIGGIIGLLILLAVVGRK